MNTTPTGIPDIDVRKKRQLSADAALIVALMKKQPQNKEELIKTAQIDERTFYRLSSRLQRLDIIKRTDGMYALKGFDFTEKTIEDAFLKFLNEGRTMIYSDFIVNEVGKPWQEIQSVTFSVAKKLALTVTRDRNDIIFIKTG